jgi:hypothetical protein
MRSMTLVFWSALVLALVPSGKDASAGVLVNGDFSTPGTPPEAFAGWTTTLADFGRPTDGGGFALFAETGPLGSQLEQGFLLPEEALRLSFEFTISTETAGAATSPVPDSFQATLFDASGSPLLSAGDPGLFPAFYSIDNVGATPQFFDSRFVSVADLGGGLRRVILDVSTVPSGAVVLDFTLNGGADGRSTAVALDNVVLETAAVPEPSTVISALIGVGGLLIVGGCGRFRLRS